MSQTHPLALPSDEVLLDSTPPTWHRQLSIRLGAGVVLVLVAALALAGIWIGRQEQRRFEEQHREHAAQVARMVARVLSERMLAGGGIEVWRDVTDVSRELKAAAGAARIMVLARDGRVKSSTDPALEGHRFSREADPECTDCHAAGMGRFPASVVRSDGHERLLRVVGAIDKEAACAGCHREPETFRGMIAIDFDLSGPAAAAKSRERFLFAIGLAAASGMFLLIFLLLRSLVHAPMGDLMRSARELGAGNLGSRTRVRRRDEFGRLTGEFNRMAARIQEQVDRIESGRREMELVYNLVVEVSRNLEVAHVRGAVLNVLCESLPFERLYFCVEAADRSWSTEIVLASGERQVFSGAGELAALVSGESPGLEAAMPGVPAVLLRDAAAKRVITRASVGGSHYLILPFDHHGCLAGIVVASYMERAQTGVPDGQLLENLSAHIGLALDNALNFTKAITDGLTGLVNKRHGLARLEEALYLSRRHGTAFALLMVDIDYFKKVNDAHGHLAGDRVLKAVAARLFAACRTADVAVRYGGEEFMLLLPHTPTAALMEVGERFRRCVECDLVSVGDGVPALAITVSVGAAAWEAPTDTAEALIGRADQALYTAKREGRNGVVVASPKDPRTIS